MGMKDNPALFFAVAGFEPVPSRIGLQFKFGAIFGVTWCPIRGEVNDPDRSRRGVAWIPITRFGERCGLGTGAAAGFALLRGPP